VFVLFDIKATMPVDTLFVSAGISYFVDNVIEAEDSTYTEGSALARK